MMLPDIKAMRIKSAAVNIRQGRLTMKLKVAFSHLPIETANLVSSGRRNDQYIDGPFIVGWIESKDAGQ